MNLSELKIDKTWQGVIGSEFNKPYLKKLEVFLKGEVSEIYPEAENIFAALNLTPLNKVKVVVLGQDPYHGEEQAHGLAFSVRKGIKLPPSLRNIYKELEEEFKTTVPESGDLSAWAKQGVLLLNATLTVEASKAGSHQGRGWENFTDAIIKEVSDKNDNVVFMLWGAYAQKKSTIIDSNKHLILKAPHPSPLSAYRGFFGCNHFIKANKYLQKYDKAPITWVLPN